LTRVALYDAVVEDAALDVGLSHALMLAAGASGAEALRVWTPPAALSFGRLDLLAPRAAGAIAAARGAGLEPVRRLAGGRAAAIGAGTACLGWASAAAQLEDMRYEITAAVLLDALGRLGVAARIGELAGEWCPGAWSVLVGEKKVGGLAQRVARGGAWAEAVVIVDGAKELAAALDQVQRALGIDWAPGTMGALSDAVPGVTPAEFHRALHAALTSRWDAQLGELSPELWREARRLRAEHSL